MAAKDTPCRLTSTLLLMTTFFLNPTLSGGASDSISLGRALSGNQTLISKQGTFALGFFTHGKSLNFYIGIWYHSLPGQTVIWVANREAPISDPAASKLQFSDLGTLVLLNPSNSPVWSTNQSAKAVVAILLDSGNLVLRNDSSSDVNLWQSFAHPTDTWMPGGWLGVNKITGEYQRLTAWKSSEDPSPGLYMQTLNPDGTNEYVLMWNGSNIYWNSGAWNGQYFANVPGTSENTPFNFTFIDDENEKIASYSLKVSNIITRYVVNSQGQAQQWFWEGSQKQWQTEFMEPLTRCGVYSLCGPFGICDENNTESVCRCAVGFQPASAGDWAIRDWSSGCVRKTQLKCGERDGFLKMASTRLPVSTREDLNAANEAGCKESCLSDCSCTAYAFDPGCSIWKGELVNLQQPDINDDDEEGSGTLFLRLAASDLSVSTSSNKKVVGVILGAATGVVAVLAIAVFLLCMSKRRKRSQPTKMEGALVQFSYNDLQKITKNFTVHIGSGGFGSVFKGKLVDLTPVAVKKLEGSIQGEKQFRTEVRTLGTIQHINLVRLHGFCSEDSKRLLVYELMPNGSLDSKLFSDGPMELNWDLRLHIILGTARALAYLHEGCRECIVHCDVKPDNVLLDAQFNAKVSDFGMAKLIGRDFSKAMTTMRGTVGYLAPEWIAGMPITPKVDSYSFGMMIFEVVSGKRNNLHFDDGSIAFYPLWAAQKVVEGDVLSLLDKRLEGEVELVQLTRVCRVACWCIQDLEYLRPGMGQVVQILEEALDVNVPPLPAALQNLVGNQTCI